MRSDNLTPHPSAVTAADRSRITGARPVVYWMTGLSGAGKSTIAALAEKKLLADGFSAVMLDGDTVRTGLCAGLGFTPDDRCENLRRIAHLAKILAETGQVVLVCTISPDRTSREQARAIIAPAVPFVEVYIDASVEVCSARDPKGLYRRAIAGEIPNFTGISAPYEVPETPDITLDTTATDAVACADVLVTDALARCLPPEELLCTMAWATKCASDTILTIYNGAYSVSFKEDRSPLTSADLASNKVIGDILRERAPACAILSEEDADSTDRLMNNAGVFIVDPIDGTKEFIAKNGEFCVSIGFAHRNRVIGGVIAVPAKGWLYYAWEGMGAYKCDLSDIPSADAFTLGMGRLLRVSDRTDQLVVVASRSHPDAATASLLEKNAARIADTLSVGSCLKGCYIAEGIADVHYRWSAFMKEWDTAAMEILCREAGAIFTDVDGHPMPANRADPVNRNGFRILNHPASALDTDGIES